MPLEQDPLPEYDDKTYHIGFTGSREGMTRRQRLAFIEEVRKLRREARKRLGMEHIWFHHGCCVGADEEAHTIVRRSFVKLIGHPPTAAKFRMRLRGQGFFRLRRPKTYLLRDDDIVDESDVVIACPKTAYEEPRSGTWYTYKQAEKHKKRRILIAPDGYVTRFPEGL